MSLTLSSRRLQYLSVSSSIDDVDLDRLRLPIQLLMLLKRSYFHRRRIERSAETQTRIQAARRGLAVEIVLVVRRSENVAIPGSPAVGGSGALQDRRRSELGQARRVEALVQIEDLEPAVQALEPGHRDRILDRREIAAPRALQDGVQGVLREKNDRDDQESGEGAPERERGGRVGGDHLPR